MVQSFLHIKELLLPIFGFPHKNKKNTKKNIIRYSEEIHNIIAARKGWWNAHKMVRNWLRRCKKCKN
jgi:hypothetical protein